MKSYIGGNEEEIKKIGKKVLFIKTKEGNPRNGEGAFIRLKNSTIMFAYTEYVGDSWLDHAEARISAYYSYDEGESWQDKRVLVEKKPDEMTVVSVSLMRMANGDLGMFYCRKTSDGRRNYCVPVFVRSADEGITWSEPVRCFEKDNYYVLNNDRVIRLENGRIIVPVALHDCCSSGDIEANIVPPGKVIFAVSDDDGFTWKQLNCVVQSPFDDSVQLQEPGLYQHTDGKLWLWSRTNYGCQYQAFSTDDGENWSMPEPNVFFSSPCSPLSVKKAGKYVAAVYNPIPTYISREMREPSARTPLLCAISSCDGKGFEMIYYIEDDPENGYCYTAIFEGDDYFLAAYYHSNDTPVCLNATKIVKVKYSELWYKAGENIVSGKIY